MVLVSLGSNELALERKSMPMVAWYMLSKESYMNRVIREVLPTGEDISIDLAVSCFLARREDLAVAHRSVPRGRPIWNRQ